MHVLLIAEFDQTGGTRTYFELLVIHLQEQGHDVFALLQSPEHDEKLDFFITTNKIKYRRLKPKKHIWKRTIFSQIWELANLLPVVHRFQPDLILSSVGSPLSWLTVLWFNIPSLQVLHTSPTQTTRAQGAIVRQIMKRISPHRKLVTVSQYASSQAMKFWDKRLDVIYNPTRYPQSVHCKNLLTKKIVVTIGHVIEYKNPYVWLEVAKKVLQGTSDAAFYWYGDGPLLDTMRKLCEDYDNIYFLGSTDRISDVLKKCRVYFQPSLIESLGMSVIEAMSFGLPCVVSDRGGLPEIVLDSQTGFVEDAEDVEQLAQKIRSLLDDAAFAHDMGLCGQERVKELFMPERWGAHLDRLLSNAMDGI